MSVQLCLRPRQPTRTAEHCMLSTQACRALKQVRSTRSMCATWSRPFYSTLAPNAHSVMLEGLQAAEATK